MSVSGQPHAPAALPPGSRAGTPYTGSSAGTIFFSITGGRLFYPSRSKAIQAARLCTQLAKIYEFIHSCQIELQFLP